MLLGGDEALKKHLTVEVQRKLGDLLNSSTPAGMDPMQALSMARAAGGDNLETFEAGPVLLTYTNPAQRQKLEVRIDGEEVRGGECQMRLSPHSFRDGAEEELPVSLRFILSWKAQQNVWRLNAISVGVTFPVGDPRLYDKSRWTLPGAGTAGAVPASRVPSGSEVATQAAAGPTVVGPAIVETAVAPSRVASTAAADTGAPEPGTDAQPAHPAMPNEPPKMTAARAVRLIGLAEDIYAKKHPETGFTCFLSELVNVGRGFEDGEPYKFMDSEFAPGVYNGYRFSLVGCAGSPVKSFQVTAEPVSGAGRAYCSDATHTLRGSDDGSSASCLASGKVVRR